MKVSFDSQRVHDPQTESHCLMRRHPFYSPQYPPIGWPHVLCSVPGCSWDKEAPGVFKGHLPSSPGSQCDSVYPVCGLHPSHWPLGTLRHLSHSPDPHDRVWHLCDLRLFPSRFRVVGEGICALLGKGPSTENGSCACL